MGRSHAAPSLAHVTAATMAMLSAGEDCDGDLVTPMLSLGTPYGTASLKNSLAVSNPLKHKITKYAPTLRLTKSEK